MTVKGFKVPSGSSTVHSILNSGEVTFGQDLSASVKISGSLTIILPDITTSSYMKSDAVGSASWSHISGSEIFITPIGNVTSSNVQDAIEELSNDMLTASLSTGLGNLVDVSSSVDSAISGNVLTYDGLKWLPSHISGSEIFITPIGNVTSSNVQDAIEELSNDMLTASLSTGLGNLVDVSSSVDDSAISGNVLTYDGLKWVPSVTASYSGVSYTFSDSIVSSSLPNLSTVVISGTSKQISSSYSSGTYTLSLPESVTLTSNLTCSMVAAINGIHIGTDVILKRIAVNNSHFNGHNHTFLGSWVRTSTPSYQSGMDAPQHRLELYTWGRPAIRLSSPNVLVGEFWSNGSYLDPESNMHVVGRDETSDKYTGNFITVQSFGSASTNPRSGILFALSQSQPWQVFSHPKAGIFYDGTGFGPYRGRLIFSIRDDTVINPPSDSWVNPVDNGIMYIHPSGTVGIQKPYPTASFHVSGAMGSDLVAQAGLTSITTDASQGNVFAFTLTGSATLENPTNLIAGFKYEWIISQDASGDHSLTFGSNFKFPSGTLPILSTGSNAIDRLNSTYNGTVLLSTMDNGFE